MASTSDIAEVWLAFSQPREAFQAVLFIISGIRRRPLDARLKPSDRCGGSHWYGPSATAAVIAMATVIARAIAIATASGHRGSSG